MVERKVTKKKAFLNIYEDWCIFSRKMAVETLQDPDVFSSLNENYIDIRIDFGNEKDIALLLGLSVGITLTVNSLSTARIVLVG